MVSSNIRHKSILRDAHISHSTRHWTYETSNFLPNVTTEIQQLHLRVFREHVGHTVKWAGTAQIRDARAKKKKVAATEPPTPAVAG